MGFSIQDVFGGSLLDGIKGLVEQFHISPEDKAKLQAQLDAERDKVDAAEKDYNSKLNDIAGQNIRAEESSGDNYTRRARPSVIWVGLGVIVWNYCVLTTFSRWLHTAPVDLPAAFWETWGIICTGYVFNRTAEKIMGMPGDSSIKLPFGIQMGQKSPAEAQPAKS